MEMMDHWDHYRWSWVSGGWLKKEAHGGRGNTLQGINISHLGKRKIIFKMPFLGDMLVPRRVTLKKICIISWLLRRFSMYTSFSVFLRWFVLFFWLDKESTNQNRSLWIYNKFFENQLWDYLVREASHFLDMNLWRHFSNQFGNSSDQVGLLYGTIYGCFQK